MGPVQRHHGADLGRGLGRVGDAGRGGVLAHERPTLSAGDLRARTTAGLSDWTSLGASTSYTVVPTSSTPGTVTVSWAVRDRPSYSTGSYSARAVFTIAEP